MSSVSNVNAAAAVDVICAAFETNVVAFIIADTPSVIWRTFL